MPEDWESSLNPPEFKEMIEQLRHVWRALGCGDHDLTTAEHSYRDRFKKSVVARKNIRSGEQIDGDSISFKCSGTLGLAPGKADRVLGRRAAVDIRANALLLEGMVE